MRIWRLGLHGGHTVRAIEVLRCVWGLKCGFVDAAAVLGGGWALRIGVGGLLLRALQRVAARVMVAGDGHRGRVRLARRPHRVLVQRRIVVPLEMARTSKPFITSSAVVSFWSSRFV